MGSNDSNNWIDLWLNSKVIDEMIKCYLNSLDLCFNVHLAAY